MLPATCSDPYFLLPMLASVTQVNGSRSGYLFDPATLQPFTDGPAMSYVLGVWRWV
jgi:hypothetical protein